MRMFSLSATVLGLALSGLTPAPVGTDVPRPLQERLQLLDGHLEILSLRSHSASYVSGISNIVIGGLFGFLAWTVSSSATDPYSQAMGFFFWTLAITSVLDGVVELVFVPDGMAAYERFADLPAETEDQVRHKVIVGRNALRGLASTAMLRRIL